MARSEGGAWEECWFVVAGSGVLEGASGDSGQNVWC